MEMIKVRVAIVTAVFTIAAIPIAWAKGERAPE
jgi:hypothetical protein